MKSSKIELISSDIYSSHLISEITEYSIIEIENKKHKVIIEDGSPIINLGFPEVPKLTTSIIIPDNGNVDFEIIDLEYEDIKDINILPSKGNITRDIDPSTLSYTFGKAYNSNEFYPINLVELSEPYIVRSKRGLTVSFNSVQYNPISRTLRIYKKIEIKINSTSTYANNILERSKTGSKPSKEFSYIYENLFINSQNDVRFEHLDDYGSMLIICYDDFIDEMQPFVEWKNKKGINTDIIGISSIGDNVTSMQSFIDNYYYENNLTYLLLVGDEPQIPTHIVNGAASDPTFGFIDGDDSFAEVIVGRFSANNPSELQTQIDRTLDYEKNPEISNYFNNALGIGSDQGPGYGGLSDDDFNDLIWDDFLSDYTYQNFEGVYDPNGSVSQGIDIINNGVGIINYTGHAGPTGWGNGAPLGVNDVNDLENAGQLPFIFTVGCNPGEFNNYGECFCEAWMRATDEDGNATGAVAHLGSTISQSWEPPMHGQWAMNSILTESYDSNLSRSFGGISVNGCMHMNEAQGANGINETNHWTIFGDPSITVRTDQPTNIFSSYNDAIFVGQTEFVIEVNQTDVLGALSLNGELIASALSSGGVIVFDLANILLEPGVIDLVLTSFNTIPHMDTINVGAPDGAYIVYDGINLINDSNFNDIIEFGETIEMHLQVQNIGNFNANAINVEISTNDEYISMINSESSIAYAIMGEIAITEGEMISFEISNNIPDNHLVQFQAILDNGDNIWEFSFGVSVSAPVFEISNLIFEDEGMDGVWDPGESATISVELINSGSASFNWYPGAIINTENPFVTILSGENDNTFYGIGPNTAYEGSFQIHADINTPANTSADFNISWGYSPTAPCDQQDCIEQANLNYNVIIGHPSTIIWDPSNTHNSGDKLVEHFNDIGLVSYDYITTQEVPNFENYLTAFIFLGVYPENYILQENDVSGLVDFLYEGKNIYLEGGDTWVFDMQTSLQSLFGLLGIADGSGDLSSVTGSSGSFAEGLSMSYTGGNNYIDQLSPSGGFPLLENDIANYITAVGYENMPIGYRTIGASHELGGLQGDNFEIYMNNLLEFFDYGWDSNPQPECNAGDINQDGIIDVTDIIRMVNIIINTGVPATDLEICAGDLNLDEEVNVLDVLFMINVILDSPRERSTAIENVNVVLENNKVEISSVGDIKGIQFNVESSGELLIDSNLNMDIAYNNIDNNHIGLIYSMSGSMINKNSFNLFETTDSYTVNELIIVNADNQIVEILYENNSLPSEFILKQNYPNPFNPTTSIDIIVSESDYLKLLIYDISGNLVNVLADNTYNKGSYTFVWNGDNFNGYPVSSGMYIYSLIGTNKIESKRMLLIK